MSQAFLRRCLVALVTAVLMPVPALLSGSVHAAERPPAAAVFGDSITFEGASALQALRPAWSINGVRGRQARVYHRLARNYRAVHGRPPRRLVIALGTNEVGATRRLYRDAVAELPRHATVVLVSTYRDPAVFGEDRAKTMAVITRWMKRVASTRARTCVAPWRAAVMRDPSLLRDGVHASAQGVEVWAGLVSATVAHCEAEVIAR